MTAEWWFRASPQSAVERWDWATQPPPVYSIAPVRRTHSSEYNRHVPVTAYSTTTGSHIWLESGLEHDLVRRLDRQPAVAWLVPQPLELRWHGSRKFRHVPDLLSVEQDGTVTVWDARNPRRMDERFTQQSDRTRDECAAVGWRYEVFAGLGAIERLNLLWLHGFRRKPAWHDAVAANVIAAVRGRDDAVLGDLFALDDGTGETISATWHLVWNGSLQIDLTSRLSAESPVSATQGESDG